MRFSSVFFGFALSIALTGCTTTSDNDGAVDRKLVKQTTSAMHSCIRKKIPANYDTASSIFPIAEKIVDACIAENKDAYERITRNMSGGYKAGYKIGYRDGLIQAAVDYIVEYRQS